MNQIERSFKAVLGRPCWGVRGGVGSFLVLEFGQPRLEVRDPIVVADTYSTPRVRRLLRSRTVTVVGRWHLWIDCCAWEVRSSQRLVGTSLSSSRGIDRAAAFLDGQKLIGVALDPRRAATTFEFDLGGRLRTKPYARSSEQWMLYEPNGKVLILRSDRRFKYEAEPWQPPASKQAWRRLTG
jgi:hypothetical protein